MQFACAILSSVSCPALQHFSTLSNERHDFRENVIDYAVFAFRASLQLLSETFFILRRTERDMIKNVYRSSCIVPAIVVRF
jgi:hypothetical protein